MTEPTQHEMLYAAALLSRWDGDPVHLKDTVRQVRELAIRLAPIVPPVVAPAPVTTAPAPAPTGTSGSLYVNPGGEINRYIAANPTAPEGFRRVAAQPTAIWLGGWSGKISDQEPHALRIARFLPPVLADAKAKQKIPSFVLYDVPLRDFTGVHSAGGVDGAASYKAWIDAIELACRTAAIPVKFYVEPDALADLPALDAARKTERMDCLRYALGKLKAFDTYIDAAHPRWVPPVEMAARLAPLADVMKGFILNVSNRVPTQECKDAAAKINQTMGKSFRALVDTSRNGAIPPNGEWCNPPWERLGAIPSFASGTVWAKVPGESDGVCNGGPVAGAFSAALLNNLLRTA